MISKLESKAKKIRRLILKCTTAAGSGHPSSSLSATDLMTVLMHGGYFYADYSNPKNLENDRLIFSKGHASPLFFSLYASLKVIEEEELMKFRQFGSRLEGHPTLEFPFTEVATGSLGQGLGVAVGYGLVSKMRKKQGFKEFNNFVLIGDSEFSEGSVFEAMQLAAHYNLDNIIGFLDVNRLGQRGETMFGHDTIRFEKICDSFGWETSVIDGHKLDEISQTLQTFVGSKNRKPKMIIAKTLKGKGVSFMEDKDNWHGKALNQQELEAALKELD